MENFLSSPILYNLALTLIHFLWQGGLIALALKLLLLVTPYTKPNLRYTWATSAMLVSFITPIITYISIYQPTLQDIETKTGQVEAIFNSQNFAINENISWYLELFDTLPYISVLWVFVVTLLASKLAIELYHVNQIPKLASVTPSEELNRRFHSLSSQVGLKKTPQLLISLKAEIPMAIGWIKPVILIPASMISGLAPAQLDMLILHELAHIRRHDYLVNFIQTLVETLLFFHPCVCWISKQMRNEREYCSDDIAVNISGNPIAYAHTLADTATICAKHRHHAIPTMAMAASGGDLKQRVVRLVDQHHCSSTDDSGKFLASILIIFSIIAVAVKPYLNNNIIDFTSGRISLFKTANEFIQQKPTNPIALPSTSIAQLLLQQDRLISKESIQLTPSITSELKRPEAIKNKLPTKFNNSKNIELEISSDMQSLLVDDVKNNNDLIIENSSIVNKKKNYQSTNAVASKTELLLDNKQEKSISEKAFERTNSKKNKVGLNNPYSQQVANLSKSPSFNHLMSDLSKEKKIFIDSDINKSVKSRKKPAYTISKPKQSVVKKPTIIRKSADILVSTDPKYPSTAKRKGIEIDVQVEFIIDINGYVKDIEFEQKSKVNYFRSAIRTALAKWRFLPAQVNNKPVESKMSKIFSFSLMQ